MSQNPYSIEKISDITYRIEETSLTSCYLLLGEKRALLIDTGNGGGNLKKAVRKLTDLPLTVVLTHMHCDHAGGSGWFKKVYVNENDIDRTHLFFSTPFMSRLLAKAMKIDCSFPKQPYKRHFIPIRDGHVFDLGGRKITCLNLPGHTTGSIVLLDDKEKLMFLGDNGGPKVLLIFPGGTTFAEWLPSIKKVDALCQEYKPYWAHDGGKVTPEQIHALAECSEKYLASKHKNAWPGGLDVVPSKDSDYAVVVRTKMIFPKKHKK